MLHLQKKQLQRDNQVSICQMLPKERAANAFQTALTVIALLHAKNVLQDITLMRLDYVKILRTLLQTVILNLKQLKTNVLFVVITTI